MYVYGASILICLIGASRWIRGRLKVGIHRKDLFANLFTMAICIPMPVVNTIIAAFYLIEAIVDFCTWCGRSDYMNEMVGGPKQ